MQLARDALESRPAALNCNAEALRRVRRRLRPLPSTKIDRFLLLALGAFVGAHSGRLRMRSGRSERSGADVYVSVYLSVYLPAKAVEDNAKVAAAAANSKRNAINLAHENDDGHC